MEQYKVILVDDEVEVIDAMQALIHWDELGFEVVGSANKRSEGTGTCGKTSAGCGVDGY